MKHFLISMAIATPLVIWLSDIITCPNLFVNLLIYFCLGWTISDIVGLVLEESC